jgi:hypothetical protein
VVPLVFAVCTPALTARTPKDGERYITFPIRLRRRLVSSTTVCSIPPWTRTTTISLCGALVFRSRALPLRDADPFWGLRGRTWGFGPFPGASLWCISPQPFVFIVTSVVKTTTNLSFGSHTPPLMGFGPPTHSSSQPSPRPQWQTSV